MITKDPDPRSRAETERRGGDTISHAPNARPKPNKNYIGKSAPPPRREPKGSSKGRR